MSFIQWCVENWPVAIVGYGLTGDLIRKVSYETWTKWDSAPWYKRWLCFPCNAYNAFVGRIDPEFPPIQDFFCLSKNQPMGPGYAWYRLCMMLFWPMKACWNIFLLSGIVFFGMIVGSCAVVTQFWSWLLASRRLSPLFQRTGALLKTIVRPIGRLCRGFFVMADSVVAAINVPVQATLAHPVQRQERRKAREERQAQIAERVAQLSHAESEPEAGQLSIADEQAGTLSRVE